MKTQVIVSMLSILSLASLVGCSGAAPNEEGSVEVFFCPDCARLFMDRLASAERSLDCALYDVDGEAAWDALDAASARGVEVRLIMDDDYRKEAGERAFVRFDTRSGLMHNKFCIIDGRNVLTGSMNPTVNDMTRNYNNVLLVNTSGASGGLAANYLTEFEELWRGEFRRGSPNARTQFMIRQPLMNVSIEQYFCPEDQCERHVIEQINLAEDSIRFMTFSFTSMPVAFALIGARARGVAVSGLYEKRQVNAYSVYDELQAQGIPVTISANPSGGQLHHKVFIIDDRTVIAGSYNPTKNGNSGNDENLLVMHDEGIAQAFLDEFGRIAAASTAR